MHVTNAANVRTVSPDVSKDALYRAALTFLLDGADAMMYAAIKGAPDAQGLWQLLAETHPNQPANTREPALTQLDRVFANGITRWGRSVSPKAMTMFHRALAGWHSRMDDLPSPQVETLADWFTVDGSMQIIGPAHPCWPHQLEDLSIRSDWAPPLCLWVKGDPRALVSCDKPIGIVGSRDVNEYGRYVAHAVAEQAAVAGHLVVSGGAMGTDAAAHWGALNAMNGREHDNVGRTVAVFAGGLNHMGPSRNRALFERIEAQSGAAISELCPGTIPEARRFLLRNRIIAALSSTLVVAQARPRSGALNTAGWACELMREVYAAPGDINQPSNAGCNRIIADQRAMILCTTNAIDDICHERHRPVLGKHSSPDQHRQAVATVVTSAPNAAAAPHTTTTLHTTQTIDPPPINDNELQPQARPASTPPPHTSIFPATRHVPDLRGERTPPGEAIALNTLSEPQRIMVQLIRECNKRHLIATPDTLLHVARTLAPAEVPNIGCVLELLGALELLGVVERHADALALSDRLT
ncbi:DNA-processing protein DprA [Bifidobacterium oedipodis]|nr:DNA-processing protein DprA [Bifidobacterium sp. DSM 109957]